MSLRLCLIAAFPSLFLATGLRAQEPAATPKETFWVIPHTHWEGAVFKTREEYLEMGLPNLLKVMRILREQPEFRFTLDQVAYVRPFLERYPEELPDFRRFLAEGRLQLAGALDVMPDVNMPGGETFIRQMQYGKGYYRDKLGVDVTTSWQLDTFGHHAQIPQLLAQAGYKSFWFFRGVPRQDYPSEFFWEGIDGTRIAAYWLPHGYGLMYGSPREEAGFANFVKKRFAMLDPNARGADRIGPAGVDVSAPEEHLTERVAAFNRSPRRPFNLRLAVPADVEAAVSRRSDRPVFKGELNPIFQGIYSSRIELKAWMRRMEERMLTAEKLSALGACLGVPADLEALSSAWEPALFNQTHDLASGVMTDHVYEDTIRGYECAERQAESIIQRKWGVLASRIDTRGPGSALVVFNPLGWARTDLVEVALGFGAGGVGGIEIRDGEGRAIPAQILESTRYWDGGLQTAKVAFIARDVPAIGYATYHAVATKDARGATAGAAGKPAAGEAIFENEIYRVALDATSGAITSLVYKPERWQVLAGRGNLVARQQDHGDLWELNKGLDGGSRIAMTTKQSVPKRGQAVYSDEGKANPGTVVAGPVLSRLSVARPMGSGTIATTVSVYAGLRRIEITTRLVNREKYVRYQAIFPTTIKEGKSTHEIPFGSIDRPAGIEFPAQNWVDHGDGKRGLALLNIGLPGNVATDGAMMVSLLRSHTLGAYGFGGGYEPGMSSESGLQLDQERTMRYALVPHAGDWRAARVFRDGLEFNHPLICRKEGAHPGDMPGRWGLIEVSNPDVVVSALQPTRDGALAVRVYEAAGRHAAGVAVKFNRRIRSARETNLLNDPGVELSVQDDAVRLDLHPFQIKTIKATP